MSAGHDRVVVLEDVPHLHGGPLQVARGDGARDAARSADGSGRHASLAAAKRSQTASPMPLSAVDHNSTARS